MEAALKGTHLSLQQRYQKILLEIDQINKMNKNSDMKCDIERIVQESKKQYGLEIKGIDAETKNQISILMKLCNTATANMHKKVPTINRWHNLLKSFSLVNICISFCKTGLFKGIT